MNFKTNLEGNALFGVSNHDMEQLKISGVRLNSQDEHEKGMYHEAAKRVVFWRCMEHCEIDPTSMPNFNGKFYYTMHKEQNCLQTCFNAKMLLHFGATTCKEQNLFMDFERMKKEYQAMENWNPHYKHAKKYMNGYDEEKVQSMTQTLLERTKRVQQNNAYWVRRSNIYLSI